MAARLASIEGQDADFIGRENERIRKTILQVATKEFLEKGYEQARVADIMRKAGVSSQVFYGFFPSKGELLVESFMTLLSWTVTSIEPALQKVDPGERLLERTYAGARMYEFELSVLSLIRAEARDGNADDLAKRVEQAWAPIMGAIALEYERALRQGVPAPVPLELLAYSSLGALHYAMMRAVWDDRFSYEDVLATHLWLVLTLLDALKRQEDPDPHISRYKDLIKNVAARGPASPPLPEE
jgi:AcrR family transcriptional regulator